MKIKNILLTASLFAIAGMISDAGAMDGEQGQDSISSSRSLGERQYAPRTSGDGSTLLGNQNEDTDTGYDIGFRGSYPPSQQRSELYMRPTYTLGDQRASEGMPSSILRTDSYNVNIDTNPDVSSRSTEMGGYQFLNNAEARDIRKLYEKSAPNARKRLTKGEYVAQQPSIHLGREYTPGLNNMSSYSEFANNNMNTNPREPSISNVSRDNSTKLANLAERASKETVPNAGQKKGRLTKGEYVAQQPSIHLGRGYTPGLNNMSSYSEFENNNMNTNPSGPSISNVSRDNSTKLANLAERASSANRHSGEVRSLEQRLREESEAAEKSRTTAEEHMDKLVSELTFEQMFDKKSVELLKGALGSGLIVGKDGKLSIEPLFYELNRFREEASEKADQITSLSQINAQLNAELERANENGVLAEGIVKEREESLDHLNKEAQLISDRSKQLAQRLLGARDALDAAALTLKGKLADNADQADKDAHNARAAQVDDALKEVFKLLVIEHAEGEASTTEEEDDD